MKLETLGLLSWAFFSSAVAVASQPVCDVAQFGAKADGKTPNTAAIQAAIDSCGAKPGGGIVEFSKPSGNGGNVTYMSGTISVTQDNITLQIDPGVTLQGIQGGDAIYPPLAPQTTNSQLLNCRKSLIYANRVHGLMIDGGGTIDGNGGFSQWGGSAKEATRPMAIFAVQSDGVTIQNLSVNNAAMWGIVMMETDHVHINNLTEHTPFGPTRDGIDIVDGQHVLIENSSVYSEDDAICLKSGIARGTVDVTVRNCHVLQSSVANGLKIGTATTGLFADILFENDTVENVDKAALAVESVDGADIKNVTFRNIQFHHAGTGFFVILGRRGGPGKTGSIDGVTFQNVTGDQMKHAWGSAISGTVIGANTFSPTNITFDNVQAAYLPVAGPVPALPPEYDGRYPDPNLWGNLPGKALFVRHVTNIQLLNGTTFTLAPGVPDPRPFVAVDDETGTIPAALEKP